MPYNPKQWFLSLAALTLLTACGSDDSAERCESGANLLADPTFASLGKSRRERQWSISEHAGTGSFAYEVNDGVLGITKTGKEPWALVSQTVDTSSLEGRTVRYSADIKLDLLPPEPKHGFKQGGGLSLSARENNQLALRSVLDHEPRMGSSDWTPVSVELDLPMGVTSLHPGLLHQANGVLQVRNPSLTVSGCRD